MVGKDIVVEDLAELRVVDARERPVVGVAGGVADHDPDLAELGVGLFDQGRQGLLGGDVGGDGDRPPLALGGPDFRGHGFAGVLVAGRDRHARAVLGQAYGDGLADAPRRARDNGDLSGQIEQLRRHGKPHLESRG